MELHFERSQTRSLLAKLRPALLLTALWCAACGMLRLFSPFAFLGLLPTLAFVFLPQKARRWGILATLVLTAAFLLLQLRQVTEGLQMLANRMFAASESGQSYEYDYFAVAERPAALAEGLALLSLATALVTAIHGGGVLTALLLFAQAYFGVTPAPLWEILLLLALLPYVLPQERLWLHWLAAALVVALAALLVTAFFATPNVRLASWEEQARDHLALHSVFYERTAEEIKVPTTEEVQPPPQEPQQRPVETPRQINILFYVLAILTLLLLFVPAVVRDRAQKKRTRNRMGIEDPDCSAAIRAMYLHSRKWLRLKPEQTPPDVTQLWLEAAYSDHVMTPEQRAQMQQYLDGVEQTVWAASGKRERFRIRYRLCL